MLIVVEPLGRLDDAPCLAVAQRWVHGVLVLLQVDKVGVLDVDFATGPDREQHEEYGEDDLARGVGPGSFQDYPVLAGERHEVAATDAFLFRLVCWLLLGFHLGLILSLHLCRTD